MDLTESIAPKSDQLNAEDLLTGPRTFTIEKVSAGNPEQPVNVHLVELPGRPYRPSKSMRRILVSAWGKDSSVYTGRRLTLYRDPEVTFGRDKVGGIKISHLSHIEKRMTVALTVTRGKRAMTAVEPLAEPAAREATASPRPQPAEPIDWDARIAEATTVDALRNLWSEASNAGADPQVLDAIKAAATAAAQN
jgi:hypothetical protein